MSLMAPGAVVASRYEVLSMLGRGGMGAVYKTHDRALDIVVALKVLHTADPDHVVRFRSEVKLSWRVRHRNVAQLHGYGEVDGQPYITMEYVDGVDLKRLIRSGGLLWEDAYEVACQVGEGLLAIHQAGVVHRDLKPANVMRDRRGVVRVMDFGIARATDGSNATSTGVILGSPEYMSPEQIRGRVDARTDLYAFGILLYELFTGVTPFQGATPHEVLVAHLEQPPPLDATVAGRLPVALLPLLGRALAKSPADRFQTCAEMLAALQEARASLHGQPVESVPAPDRWPTPPPPAPPAPVRIDPACARLGSALLRALRHADPAVRADAARALGRGRHLSARDALVESAAGDASPSVRTAAQEALGILMDLPDAPTAPRLRTR